MATINVNILYVLKEIINRVIKSSTHISPKHMMQLGRNDRDWSTLHFKILSDACNRKSNRFNEGNDMQHVMRLQSRI